APGRKVSGQDFVVRRQEVPGFALRLGVQKPRKSGARAGGDASANLIPSRATVVQGIYGRGNCPLPPVRVDMPRLTRGSSPSGETGPLSLTTSGSNRPAPPRLRGPRSIRGRAP